MASALAVADVDAKLGPLIFPTVNADQAAQHLSIATVALTVNALWTAKVDAVAL